MVPGERERGKKKENALSSFTIYKYMYVLHLTEVLPIDGVGAALRPCGCLREKLWLSVDIKQHGC